MRSIRSGLDDYLSLTNYQNQLEDKKNVLLAQLCWEVTADCPFFQFHAYLGEIESMATARRTTLDSKNKGDICNELTNIGKLYQRSLISPSATTQDTVSRYEPIMERTMELKSLRGRLLLGTQKRYGREVTLILLLNWNEIPGDHAPVPKRTVVTIFTHSPCDSCNILLENSNEACSIYDRSSRVVSIWSVLLPYQESVPRGKKSVF